jgi:hypothetical protein
MEIIAIICQGIPYVAGIVGFACCFRMYQSGRNWAWLLVGCAYLQPFLLVLMRLLRGRPIFPYKSSSLGSDGVLVVNYNFEIPVLVILSVVGLVLLVRAQHASPRASTE